MSAATGVQELETRLTEMLESVQGAGKVQVMITLESAGETVYARDEQSDTQTTQDGSAGVTDRKESYKASISSLTRRMENNLLWKRTSNRR